MAKIGRSSKSFLRHKTLERYRFIGDLILIAESATNRQTIIETMHHKGLDDRALFYAENLKTYSSEELQSSLDDLSNRLHHAGIHGVVEYHPQSDQTSKSGHIHFWGEMNEKVTQIIENFIKERRLSNKPHLNYTDERMSTGTHFERIKNKEIGEEELVQFHFEEDPENPGKFSKIELTREPIDENAIAFKNAVEKEIEGDLRTLKQYCKDTLAELQLDTFGEDIEIKNEEEAREGEMTFMNMPAYLQDLEEFLEEE